jgi:ubiquinone/menaquinone biosynthesis C-methylase UbiE
VSSAPAGRKPQARLASPRSKNWDRHVDDIEQIAGSAGFQALRDLILQRARLSPGDRVLDIGAGTGLLALAAAPYVARVIALDCSSAMCARLELKLSRRGIENVEVLLNDARTLPLADDAVDVVVSNYCFHHLSDADKARALIEIKRVLRPGGRLVFADMMFRLGITNRRDRSVIALLVKQIIRRGWSGVLRLLKNGLLIATCRWEHPASVEWWRKTLTDAGFNEVAVWALEHEGGIALARKLPALPVVEPPSIRAIHD